MIERVFGLQTTGMSINARFTLLAAEAVIQNGHNTRRSSAVFSEPEYEYEPPRPKTPRSVAQSRFSSMRRINSIKNTNNSGRPFRSRMWYYFNVVRPQQRYQDWMYKRNLHHRYSHRRWMPRGPQPYMQRWRPFVRRGNNFKPRRNTSAQPSMGKWRQKFMRQNRPYHQKYRGRGYRPRPHVTREQLDAELEQYMSLSKAALDRQLDDYVTRPDETYTT